MNLRRQLVTFIVMLGFMIVWMNVAPIIFPQFFPKPQPKVDAPAVAQADKPQGEGQPAAGEAAPDAAAGDATATPADEAAPALEASKLPEFPAQRVLLGDPAAQDLQQLDLTTRGAAIASQQLLEDQYKTLDRQAQVQLVGNDLATDLRTMAIDSHEFDVLLAKHQQTLSTVNWELVAEQSAKIPGSPAYRRVVFRYPSPDGKWEAEKTYELQPADKIPPGQEYQRYAVDVRLTFRNLTESDAAIRYVLQGPVGVPLENAENTRTYRKVEAGTLEDAADPTDVSHVSLPALTIVKNEEKALENPAALPVWRYPVRWTGVDMQFFAALLIPQGDQLSGRDKDNRAQGYFERILPFVVTKSEKPEQSDVSLRAESVAINVPAGGETSHEFQLYMGPKRSELLDQFQAGAVMDFGWFGWISRGMVSLLTFFHNGLHLPYWFAIILLTVMVRGCMFPLSRKQVASLQKMKEINPKIQELRIKHANDKEAMTRAQLELMRKHGYNPFAGCLPILIQLPIFIGLYNGLNTAIDLRLARFLWADSLATPDAFVQFPFTVPLLGWTELNLLPLVTVVLFIVQNKLFTPPPTNDEQALQQKMMNVMMAVMGVMFYHVPAGLCVYFIASSSWGIAERKILDRHKRKLEAASLEAQAMNLVPPTPKPEPAVESPKTPGFLARLLEAADQAKHQTNPRSSKSNPMDRSGDSKNRSKPRR